MNSINIQYKSSFMTFIQGF